jgi:hypothetical protein
MEKRRAGHGGRKETQRTRRKNDLEDEAWTPRAQRITKGTEEKRNELNQRFNRENKTLLEPCF